ncbi:Rossmann-like and DUF2520 domain-containing protein [Ferruginibacter sp.]|uniref:Rossmann-like and DUF2520 domain-containing protein n=1 Tax=Ferruginibacter sp. TaxID=1940288 RepID=UPI0019B36FF2|nr:Rossmann-like and DUF2520 domain-containing protein [Ferruginibacter sp.]MBC7627569.1 DUF2520 domain-containing protein [Ferruginibacter sp.]
MKVVIVGAGNVATVLGRLIKNNGHDILQIVSRTANNAAILAEELNCAFTDNSGVIDKSADLYLVALTDTAMGQLDDRYHLGDKLVIHTAGSVSKEVLKNITHHYGVLYPLQSLRKQNMELQQNIPLLIDANTEEGFTALKNFADTLSANVTTANDEQRLKLHVAAVLVSNFTNHLYAMAADYCSKEEVDFKLLQPLIEETALRLRHYPPIEMRTGPAIRKDIETLQKHLQLLAPYPAIYNMYLKITDSIMNS